MKTNKTMSGNTRDINCFPFKRRIQLILFIIYYYYNIIACVSKTAMILQISSFSRIIKKKGIDGNH